MDASIVLLQVEWLLSNQGRLMDGKLVLKIGIRAAQKAWFPFYSVATISRVFSNLVAANILQCTDGDTDRLYWIGPGCAALKSVVLVDVPVQDTTVQDKSVKDVSAKPKTGLNMFQVAAAIGEVSKMDLAMNKSQLLREAKLLNKPPDEIRNLYGPGKAWYLLDFRGKQGSPPTPGQIRQTWEKLRSITYNGAKVVINKDGSASI